MPNKKKDKKATDASNKAVIAGVTEEMAQPRMSKSARIISDQRIHARDGKPVQSKIPPTTDSSLNSFSALTQSWTSLPCSPPRRRYSASTR